MTKSTINFYLDLLTVLMILYYGLALLFDLPKITDILVSFILSKIVIQGLFRNTIDGTLLVDTSDQTKDMYRLHLNGYLEDLVKKKSITLIVDTTANLSQEKHGL